MSDCCAPGSGFPTAATMQQLATNYPIIWEEICMIQQALLSASSQCNVVGAAMSATVAGSTPMTFVSGVESITVINGGLGYYQDQPAVNFIPPIGVIPSILATATVTTNGSSILDITITDPGTGYQPVPATLSVSSLSGSAADIRPLVNAAGQIVNINIVSGGLGYTVDDTVIATRAVLPNAAYIGAAFKITAVSLTGEILSIAILNPGTGYQDSVTEIEIVSSLNSLLPYPGAAGFNGTVFTDITGAVLEVAIANSGAGYSAYLPYLVISDQGTGAATTVTLSGTSIASIAVNSPGNAYTTTATGTVYNPPTASLPNPPAIPAVVTINATQNTYGTTPNLYWQVWAGVATNKPIQMQLNAVISYFKSLGYSIAIQSNPNTGSTIQWSLAW